MGYGVSVTRAITPNYPHLASNLRKWTLLDAHGMKLRHGAKIQLQSLRSNFAEERLVKSDRECRF